MYQAVVDLAKKEKLIYDSETKKVFLDESRGVLRTIDYYISSSGTPVTSTSFSALTFTEITEKENMTFDIRCIESQEVLSNILAAFNIYAYDISISIETKIPTRFRTIYEIKFKDHAEYAFFKLNFFKQIQKCSK